VKARVVKLHVHYLSEPRGRVWAIETGKRYLTAREVRVSIPLETVFRGPTARQPKAYLRGKGRVVRRPGGLLEITA
jgi:hypothetical protein